MQSVLHKCSRVCMKPDHRSNSSTTSLLLIRLHSFCFPETSVWGPSVIILPLTTLALHRTRLIFTGPPQDASNRCPGSGSEMLLPVEPHVCTRLLGQCFILVLCICENNDEKNKTKQRCWSLSALTFLLESHFVIITRYTEGVRCVSWLLMLLNRGGAKWWPHLCSEGYII